MCAQCYGEDLFFSRIRKGEKNNKHTINNETQQISIDYCKIVILNISVRYQN